MELKFWIYLIIGVIFLLTKLRKKPEQQQENQPKYEPEKPVRKYELPTVKPSANPSSKQLTFEELLKEITESKSSTTPLPSSREGSKSYQEVVDYDDNLGEEEQDLEEVDYDYKKKDNIYEVYEKAKREAFARPSLEETMKVGDTVMTFGKFKEFAMEPKRDLMAEYLADFKDPEGFRKAVVMSEILKRKF
jgi:hypothetical protein